MKKANVWIYKNSRFGNGNLHNWFSRSHYLLVGLGHSMHRRKTELQSFVVSLYLSLSVSVSVEYVFEYERLG